MHKGKMQWNFTEEAQNNKYGTKTFFALLLLCLFFSCCSRQGIKFRADSALGVFTGPADDEGEQPSSQSLTPLDASTSSVSSSLCSMCLSKGFPSRRNNWKRESSSWAGPLDDAACLLGETDGERHWPINLNSWIDGGRDGKNENCAEITENKWTTPTEGAKDTTARKTAYYIIFCLSSRNERPSTKSKPFFLLRNAPLWSHIFVLGGGARAVSVSAQL